MFSFFSIIGCPFPGIVGNGQITPDPTGPSGQYNDGTIITFECQLGYNLQGAALSTCLKGMWTAELPVCAGKLNHVSYTRTSIPLYHPPSTIGGLC